MVKFIVANLAREVKAGQGLVVGVMGRMMQQVMEVRPARRAE